MSYSRYYVRCTKSLRKVTKFYKSVLDGLKIRWKPEYDEAVYERYPNDIAIENYFIDIIRGNKK